MSVPQPWRYRAALQRVIDGDTIVVTLDLGLRVQMIDVHLRLLGLNAPEVHGTGKDDGLAASAFVESWLQAALDPHNAWPLLVETSKVADDKYGGRWDARVYRSTDGHCLNDDLLASGHAKPWDGRGAKP